MAITEKIELLGKGLYENIPDVLTLSSIPTASELDLVGSEDFDTTMLEVILPAAVQEEVDFKQLLEIDYTWICRCLRILNYGPYHTTNAIFCEKCGAVYGEHIVNLNTMQCKPLPEGFVNDIVITKDEFIDFDGDIHLKLPTIQKVKNAEKDKAFMTPSGKPNTALARMCYMISSIKGKDTLNPIEIKMFIQNELSSADYLLLKSKVIELTDYGLRVGGVAKCPKCGNPEATFLALVDDRFFRPTVGALRKWKNDKRAGEGKDISGSKTTTVREHN